MSGSGRVRLYHAITDGIRVSVRPSFAPEHSDPAEPRFVFVYRIRIENLSDATSQLRWRHWYIEDPVGDALATCRRIKTGSARRDVRVVAVGDGRLRAEALAGGCDDFLAEPLDLDQVGAALERCLVIE